MNMFLLLLLVLSSAVTLVTLRRPRREHRAEGASSDHLTSELERSRRYDHSFALVRLTASSGSGECANAPVDPTELECRRTDHCWWSDTDLYVLLPETGPNPASRLLTRFQQQMGDGVDVRMVHFPRDGLTAMALYERLDQPQAERLDRGADEFEPRRDRAIS